MWQEGAYDKQTYLNVKRGREKTREREPESQRARETERQRDRERDRTRHRTREIDTVKEIDRYIKYIYTEREKEDPPRTTVLKETVSFSLPSL